MSASKKPLVVNYAHYNFNKVIMRILDCRLTRVWSTAKNFYAILQPKVSRYASQKTTV